VNSGVEGGGTVFEESMGRPEVGLKGGMVFVVEIWWQLIASNIACTSMEY
jgi:hypothetical protein